MTLTNDFDSPELARVGFANEAFYLAFEAKDFTGMDHLWSKAREVVCIHPGWSALIGRDVVMESWRAILGNPEQGAVSFYGASYRVLGTRLYAAVCYELAGNAVMIATNVFVEEDGRLCLVLHQAGYCANPPPIPG
jgi:hypothetical protein